MVQRLNAVMSFLKVAVDYTSIRLVKGWPHRIVFVNLNDEHSALESTGLAKSAMATFSCAAVAMPQLAECISGIRKYVHSPHPPSL